MFWFPDIPPGQEKQFREGLLGAAIVALPFIILAVVLVYVLGVLE
jgi:hypothetical protein